jgi:predicted DNA-binding transcriptional regulator AlpA
MLRKTRPQFDELIEEDLPTDEEIAGGLYTYNELVDLGLVRNRTDLQRKQRFYGFPLPLKTGTRQAPFLKTRVHNWVRRRAATSRK